MAQTIFALKGKLGSTEYYVVTMKASEAIAQIRIPKNIEGWDNLSIDINNAKVKTQIAPYIANDKDRFFGSLIVAMKNCNEQFEPLTAVVKKLPLVYESSAKNAGFLTIDGGVMYPIDGRHRLQALKFAIDGKDAQGNNIASIDSTTDTTRQLANEEITVILFQFDTEKSRKIFSKINNL